VECCGDPADDQVLDCMAIEALDDPGDVEIDVLGGNVVACVLPGIVGHDTDDESAARRSSSSARKARTFSIESSRRPSAVIDTSS